VAIIAVPALILSLQWVSYREIWLSARLFPGAGKTPDQPQLPPTVGPDALKVYFGGNVATSTNLPTAILRILGETMIEVNRETAGKELVVSTLKVFDDRKNIIARIDEDGFWVENSTRNKRPNPSTLVVYDHLDHEVLRVVFVNPTTLSVSGVFRHPQLSTPIIITDEYMQIGRGRVSGSYYGNFRGAAIDVGGP
jgi:hypothetical protein